MVGCQYGAFDAAMLLGGVAKIVIHGGRVDPQT
jgi:hypothetical protein